MVGSCLCTRCLTHLDDRDVVLSEHPRGVQLQAKQPSLGRARQRLAAFELPAALLCDGWTHSARHRTEKTLFFFFRVLPAALLCPRFSSQGSSKARPSWTVCSRYDTPGPPITEVMRLPTVAQVNSLYRPDLDSEDLETAAGESTQREGRRTQRRTAPDIDEDEDDDIKRFPRRIDSSQPSRLLDQVVLHVGGRSGRLPGLRLNKNVQ